MTEKRFVYFIHNINEDDEYYEIIDKEQKYSFNDIKDEGLADQMCYWLNDMSDEIERLQKQAAEYNMILQQRGEERFKILELIDEDDGEISYLVSDGKVLIEVHEKEECAIKLKKILDKEW